MAKKEKVALYLLYEFEEIFSELDSDEERGQLIMAIYDYERRGIEPDFKGTLKFAWRTHIKPKMDKIIENYRRKCEQNRANVNKRWQQQENETAEDTSVLNSIPEYTNAPSRIKKDTNVPSRIKKDTNVPSRIKKEYESIQDIDADVDVDVDIDADKDIDIENPIAPRAREGTPVDNSITPVDNSDAGLTQKASAYYQGKIRPVKNRTELALIRQLVRTYGLDKFQKAVEISRTRGGKSLKYVAEVIKDPRPPGEVKGNMDDLREEVHGVFG